MWHCSIQYTIILPPPPHLGTTLVGSNMWDRNADSWLHAGKNIILFTSIHIPVWSIPSIDLHHLWNSLGLPIIIIWYQIVLLNMNIMNIHQPYSLKKCSSYFANSFNVSRRDLKLKIQFLSDCAAIFRRQRSSPKTLDTGQLTFTNRITCAAPVDVLGCVTTAAISVAFQVKWTVQHHSR